MTHKKEKLLAALLTSRTKKEAAKAAGISERTMRTYFDDPEFRAAYKQAAGIMDRATRQLQQNLTAAIDRLDAIVADDEETSANHITAARTLLDYGLKFTEFNDILRELESTEGEADVL